MTPKPPPLIQLAPEQRAMLDVIKYAEGTGTPQSYRTWFGNTPFEDPTQLTIGQIKGAQDRFLGAGHGGFTDNTGRRLNSAAVGAYQMLAPEGRLGKTGLTLNSPFNQDTQDRLALEYMRAEAGVTLKMLQQQGFSRQISSMMGRPWASFPGSRHNQPTKDYYKLNSIYKSRLKHYQGEAVKSEASQARIDKGDVALGTMAVKDGVKKYYAGKDLGFQTQDTIKGKLEPENYFDKNPLSRTFKNLTGQKTGLTIK